MSTPQQDPFAQAASFLSGGLTGAVWPHVGFVVEGTVKGARMMQQRDIKDNSLKFWNDGSPRMQLVVDLQCAATGKTWRTAKYVETPVPNDTGMRAMYVKGSLQRALTQALRDAQAPFEMEGYVRVERLADIPAKERGMNDAHDYRVTWTPAAQNGAPATDFLSQPEQTPAPAPQYAPPAAQKMSPFSGPPASTGAPSGPPF